MLAMRISISVLILLVAFLSLFSSVISGQNLHPGTIKSFCAGTPYPEKCTSIAQINVPIKTKSDFLKHSLQHTLDYSLQSWKNANSLGPKCRNEREKAAWSDCTELYAEISKNLNKTIDSNPSTKTTSEDVQTWLSASLTYIETCKQGFNDLGMVIPLVHDEELANLICNNLAINKGNYNGPGYTGEFPSWVSRNNRKLLQATTSAAASQANAVVAQDGSGKYRTVGAAVASAPGNGRYVIYVKAGTYSENVEIKAKSVTLIGDGIGRTIITGSKSVDGGSTTFGSATVGVVGDGFIARGITFQNTAGAAKHQAVALRSGSDFSVFYQCSFEGYQDTLFVLSNRQFYKNCDIYGTVDFIFGNAAVVIQNCNIYPRNTPTHTNTITAQGRTDPNQNTGISIHDCSVTAAPDLKPVQGSVQTYLGRPWQKYSRTAFVKTFLDGLIAPAGWYPWTGNFALDTLYYGEYMNSGPGSSTANRVKWKGVHSVMSGADASEFTVGTLISGGSWLPATGVPFTSGL